MKNKLMFFLLFLFLILSIFKELKNIKDINYKNKVISNIYDNHRENKEFEGYIEIPKFNLKNLIKSDLKALDDNYIYMMNNSLNDKKIILAGHNIKVVFRKLHYIKIDDLIYIKNNDLNYKYKVIKRKYVNIDDINIIEENYTKDILILITCTNKKNKRLVILCEKIG